MQKRVPFYGVSVFLLAAFMTAGCAKQHVTKKDEGIAPAPVARQIEQQQPVSDTNATSTTPVSTVAPRDIQPAAASADSGQSMVSNKQLQSALDKIYFNFDSADLSASARDTLSSNAKNLLKQQKANIRIEGNCDERGSSEYNLALGERRAKAAKQYLVTLGVESKRLSVVSYGNEKPAVQDKDEAGWAKNRRAEFVVESPTTLSAK